MENTGQPAQRACSFCRKRKLRCDKQRPRCHSCIRLGQVCTYISHQPFPQRHRREISHVHELEKRLDLVESLLRAERRVPDRGDSSPSPNATHEDNALAGATVSLNEETIRDLEKTYFDYIHPMMPIIHYDRYNSQKDLEVGSLPLYLRYSIWAVAALRLGQHSHHSSEYYEKARNLTDAASLLDPRRQTAFCRAQAWLHLAMYDMISGRFALSWTDTSQAIRLLQLAKVHSVDSINTSLDNSTPTTVSWSEIEEQRRAFWFAFCLDRSAFIGQDVPVLIDERDIRVNLPASDKAYQSSSQEPTVTLSQATGFGAARTTSLLSALAVVYSLCSAKLRDLQQLDPTSVHTLLSTTDWVKRDAPSQSLTVVYTVPAHLAVTKDNMDANLLYLNVMVHCATIRVHRMAQRIVQESSSPHVSGFIQESMNQCVTAATTIFDLARLACQSNLRNHHPTTSFCIYNALAIFANRFLASRDPKFGASIKFLLEFMVSLRDQSQVAYTNLRDFEADYPLLMVEFGPGNVVGTEDMMSQPSHNGVSPLPDWRRDMQFESPAQDNIDNWSPSMSDSIPRDWEGVMSWNNQAIGINYIAMHPFDPGLSSEPSS